VITDRYASTVCRGVRRHSSEPGRCWYETGTPYAGTPVREHSQRGRAVLSTDQYASTPVCRCVSTPSRDGGSVEYTSVRQSANTRSTPSEGSVEVQTGTPVRRYAVCSGAVRRWGWVAIHQYHQLRYVWDAYRACHYSISHRYYFSG
jgi:hypothetical protein